MSDNAFVHVRDLRVVFRRDGQTINAVNGVSFEVQKGEVMALIGESGSGKSVTLRALMRLHPPGRRISRQSAEPQDGIDSGTGFGSDLLYGAERFSTEDVQ